MTKGKLEKVYAYDITGIAVSQETGSTPVYYIKDTHSDTALLLSSEGLPLAQGNFDAFGNPKENISGFTNFGYAGEYTDPESGLIYLRNRYYDPSIGRFISEDPIRSGANWYVYANNNPVNYIDPTGLSSEERLGKGIWSLKSDSTGREILYHYLFGGGKELNINYLGQYMMSNKGDPDAGVKPLGEQVKNIVFPYGQALQNGESTQLELTTKIIIENGEDIIGYQYLHGTDADVGGFQIKGTVSKDDKGNITYDLTYTWNDKINPNYKYSSDARKVEFAKKIPGANPTDYIIRITWSDKTVIKAKPSWFNRNSGWLSKYD